MCMLILHTIITPQSRVKADLDSTIFAYNYRAQLAYVTTFDHPRAQFSLMTSTMYRTNVVSLIYTTQSVVKS